MRTLATAPPECPSLECVLTEAAAARGFRALEQIAGQSAAVRAGGGAGFDAVARSAMALLTLERLVAADRGGAVDLCALLNRLVTLVQLAAPGGSTMSTRLAGVEVPPLFARGVVAATLELVNVVEPLMVWTGRPIVQFVMAVEEGDLVLTVAAAPGAEVPDAAAARCMDRAVRIARLLGGAAVRGLDGGLHLAGLVCPLPGGGAGRWS